MTDKIEIVEVAPRDGLQSQAKIVDTETKIAFINRLIDAGIRRMEVVSFVNPKRVPQMADADDLLRLLPRHDDVSYIGLVLNMRGFERALQSNISEVNCVVVASDTFNQRNQGATTEETMSTIEEIVKQVSSTSLTAGVTIGASFGCPFEGEVAVSKVVKLAGRLADMGFKEIALADTIGAAGPSDVAKLVVAVSKVVGDVNLRCHFHNTRNTGVANAYVAVQEGVRILDSSCGGVGGCPFAPAATGNVATEDILYMLQRMGMETGVNIGKVIETAKWLEGPLDAQMPGMVTRAGLFPANQQSTTG
ncbi:MAG: hydroxymethylglutaryl-CoA lyase [Planctomycetota bacterium]|jgi:hydroxymethylglutaryl-CoA lyase